jgi:hypothetical protein
MATGVPVALGAPVLLELGRDRVERHRGGLKRQTHVLESAWDALGQIGIEQRHDPFAPGNGATERGGQIRRCAVPAGSEFPSVISALRRRLKDFEGARRGFHRKRRKGRRQQIPRVGHNLKLGRLVLGNETTYPNDLTDFRQ